MTDLQINVALAQAMGWAESSRYAVMLDQYEVFRQKVLCNEDGTLRKFDYRDPVIFVSICKHWNLVVNFNGYVSGMTGFDLVSREGLDVEKAAALVVIELAERGAE